MKKIRGTALKLGVAVMLLGLSVSPLSAGRTHAQVTACRSDPVVSLSNGAQMDLSADIYDSQSDIQSVTYVVHAPAGTHPLAVIGTDGLMGLKEHFQFYSDNPSNTYDFYTSVATGQASAPVTGHFTDLSAIGLVLGSSSVSGASNQTLHATFVSIL